MESSKWIPAKFLGFIRTLEVENEVGPENDIFRYLERGFRMGMHSSDLYDLLYRFGHHSEWKITLLRFIALVIWTLRNLN
jgi:hypothetical protein